MKKYKSIKIEKESGGKFCIVIDNKVVAYGLSLAEVSKKVEEYLNE